MDDTEFLKFFKAKIACSVHQIKTRGLRISTFSFRLRPDDKTGIWVAEQNIRRLHPLATFIENRKILTNKERTSKFTHIARILNCDINFIKAFHYGLSGMGSEDCMYALERNLFNKYYTFGRSIRLKHGKG